MFSAPFFFFSDRLTVLKKKKIKKKDKLLDGWFSNRSELAWAARGLLLGGSFGSSFEEVVLLLLCWLTPIPF